MGSLPQERLTRACLETLSIRESEWRKKALWRNSGGVVPRSRMGRRQSQRKPAQAQSVLQIQENIHEKRPQRRKHKPSSPVTKRNILQSSPQGTSASGPGPPAGGQLRTQAAAQRCGHREDKHGAVVSCPVPPGQQGSQEDSDTDLSETERGSESCSGRDPPPLELRPEVVEAEDEAEDGSGHRVRGRARGTSDFPDFLPPPFNSWSLSQLALFYNMEGRAAPRTRPVGPLERYLERLLQLEWSQIQTVKDESGKWAVPEVVSGCHRSAAGTSSRLSSPKCILQCQRAFPLSFLSSLASHSTLFSGCACTPFRIPHPAPSHGHPARLSPMLEHSRRPPSLPRRSYSESRVASSDKCCRAPRLSSPARTSSYLRRMQASGNIRHPVTGDAPTRPHPVTKDPITRDPVTRDPVTRDPVAAEPAGSGEVQDGREAAPGKRSGSEQRRGGAERQRNRSEKRRSGSEYRRGRGERCREEDFKEREVKPDAVTAILDNLPASKRSPIQRRRGRKQVEFIT